MNVVFRCDASKDIGMGHFFRCLALSSIMTKKGWHVVFVFLSVDEHLKILCASYEIKYLIVSDHSSDSFINCINDLSIDWLIVDHYQINNEWEIKVAGHVKKIMVIDDLEDREHYCHVLLDQNYSLKSDTKYQDLVPEFCQRLIGPKYALLREEFSEQRSNLQNHEAYDSILISMGGCDQYNISVMAIHALVATNKFKRIGVVTTDSYLFVNEIKRLASENSNVQVHHNIVNMAKLIDQYSMCFGASGHSLWERFCLGKPTFVVTIADNQLDAAFSCKKDQLIFYLGSYAELDVGRLCNLINSYYKRSILSAMSGKISKLVDGLGCHRILERINSTKKVLFLLGLNDDALSLIDSINSLGCEVDCMIDKVFNLSNYDVVFSYGYRYILSDDILNTSLRPVINLHISYLPYNRGAHPNFWAFVENTPHGVSIHEIDSGIDTGPIIFQTKVDFTNEEDTFLKTYHRLIFEIKKLFIDNLEQLLDQSYVSSPQLSSGTFHLTKELPARLKCWNTNIIEFLKTI